MPVGSVNYSNNAVNFGKRPHVSRKAKHDAAVIATGIATGAAITAGIVYRKNIGSMFVSLGGKIKKIFVKGEKVEKKAAEKVAEAVTTAGKKTEKTAKKGFKGFMKKIGGGIKTGYDKTIEFFTSLGKKVKKMFKKAPKTDSKKAADVKK